MPKFHTSKLRYTLLKGGSRDTAQAAMVIECKLMTSSVATPYLDPS